MVLLSLALLHASVARIPTAPVCAVVLQAAASSSASSSGSGSGSTGGASGSTGSSGSASSSSGSSASSTSGTVSSSGSGGGSATGSVGTQPGDGEPGSIGIPTRCNSGDDCPQNFFCTDHKCKPTSQRPPSGGCATGEGTGLLALLLGASLVSRKRAR